MGQAADAIEDAAMTYVTGECRNFSKNNIEADVSFRTIGTCQEMVLQYDMHAIATYRCKDGTFTVRPLGMGFGDLLHFDLSDPDSLNNAATALINCLTEWDRQ